MHMNMLEDELYGVEHRKAREDAERAALIRARVEAAAKVLNDLFADRCGTPSTWADEPEYWKEQFRADARAALAAADAAALSDA